MDQACQGRNEHRGCEGQGGTEVFEIRLVYAGRVFSEEFGDHSFALNLSLKYRNRNSCHSKLVC